MPNSNNAAQTFSRRELFTALFYASLAACAGGILIVRYCPFTPFCLGILSAPVLSAIAAFAARRALERRERRSVDGAILDVALDGDDIHPGQSFQAMSRTLVYDQLRRKRSERELLSATLELERRVLERTYELEELNRKLLAEIAERKRVEERLARAAGADPLTGLANRRAASEHLKYLLARHRREGETFALLLCDLDRFKRINDAFGHDAGDAALVGVAATLANVLRDQDMAVRWGGEEFLVILPDTDIIGGINVAEKIRKRVADEVFRVDGNVIRMTVSVGVSVFQGESVDAAIKAADEALYAAKREGRNRVSCENFEDGSSIRRDQ